MILLAGTAMAGTEQMEMRLGNIIQKKQLLKKREALLQDLEGIDASIQNLADETTTPPAETTTEPETTTTPPPAADTTPADDTTGDEEKSNLGMILTALGVTGAFAGVIAWVCIKKGKSDEEAEGGASDDLYSKFISSELSA